MPTDLASNDPTLLITNRDAHRSHLVQRRLDEPLRGGQRHLDGFDRIAMIQRHLRTVADATGVGSIDIGEATAMTQDLVGEIVDRLTQIAA